ncbi:MAG: cytochrome c oxidase assembly protein [Gammaproteobacteria bacterium]
MNANQKLVFGLSGIVVGMFGFGYLLVPLYDVFCEITGLNGKTATEAAVVAEAPDLSRTIRVEFTGSLNQGAPWEFRPTQVSMDVHPGKAYVTNYFAKSQVNRDAVGHAVPSVVPGAAAKYFLKTECFCFEEQAFGPGESKEMPVRFILDPDLPAHVDVVTLSYTFFEKQLAANAN